MKNKHIRREDVISFKYFLLIFFLSYSLFIIVLLFNLNIREFMPVISPMTYDGLLFYKISTIKFFTLNSDIFEDTIPQVK